MQLSENRVFVAGGYTYAQLASDNVRLFTLNSNALVKVLNLDHLENEPDVIDVCRAPSNFCISELSSNLIFVTSKGGDLFSYNIKEGKSSLLFRSPLPLRDLCLIHDENVCAVGGDDLELTLVALREDQQNIQISLRDQMVSLSYNKHNNILAVSLSNGEVVFYSLSSTIPNKVHTLEGYLPAIIFKDEDDIEAEIDTDSLDAPGIDGVDSCLCQENRTWTRVVWSNKGDQFVLPVKSGEIKLFQLSTYSEVMSFKPSVPVLNWDSLIVDQLKTNTVAAVGNTGKESHVFIWNLSTGSQLVHEVTKYSVTSLSWKLPNGNTHASLIIGTWSGDILTFNDIVEVVNHVSDQLNGQNLFMQSDEELSEDDHRLSETFGGEHPHNASGEAPKLYNKHNANHNGDVESEEINSENLFTDAEQGVKNLKRTYNFENEDDFIEDDDGQGALYKRPKQQNNIPSLVHQAKPSRSYQAPPQFQYKPFSTGGTPFANSDKRYLTINQIGHVWTTRNESGSNSITVSFFDLSRFREYHFDDIFKHDLCSLTEDGMLLGQSKLGQIHYRAHGQVGNSWTKKIPLLSKERITCIALTPKCVIVGTSFGYLRSFNQYGIPLSVEKMSPIVALASQDYKVFTVHYSQYHGISYSIFEQNPHSGNRYYQRECSLPITLPQPTTDEEDEEYIRFDDIYNAFNPIGIKALFFSTFGDPCIFGQDNVLLVLSKWRKVSESRWVPIVDTNFELWKLSGGKVPKNVHIWPLGLNYDTFSYLLLKGKNCWPDIPMTVPSEMEVRMPVLVKSDIQIKDHEEAKDTSAEVNPDDEVVIPMPLSAEEEYLRSKVLSNLLKDTMDNDGEIYGNESELLQHLILAHDKSLLRLLAYVCSEHDVGKGLSIVLELKQDKALAAARKIAERAELLTLVRKINDLIEAKFEADLNSL